MARETDRAREMRRRDWTLWRLYCLVSRALDFLDEGGASRKERAGEVYDLLKKADGILLQKVTPNHEEKEPC